MALNASVDRSDGHRRFDRGERTSRFKWDRAKIVQHTMDSLHVGSIFHGSVLEGDCGN